MASIFNIRRRKVGGIWFLRVGRLQFSFCLCRGYVSTPRKKAARERVAPVLEARTYPAGSTVVVYQDR